MYNVFFRREFVVNVNDFVRASVVSQHVNTIKDDIDYVFKLVLIFDTLIRHGK